MLTVGSLGEMRLREHNAPDLSEEWPAGSILANQTVRAKHS
jgi:hypothetical protein